MMKRNLFLGWAVALFLFILSFILFFNISYMGVRDQQVEKFIINKYLKLIIIFNLKIVLVYLLFASIIALFSFLLRIRNIPGIIGLNLFVWLTFFCYALKLMPQLFSDQFYNASKFGFWLQIIISDYLPLLFFPLLFAITILLIGIIKKRKVIAVIFITLATIYTVRWETIAIKAKTKTELPNILLIGTDSLRPKNLSYFGYFRPTPNIDALLARSTAFTAAKASLARTFSAFTSIFTSSFPPDHKIRHMFPRPEEVNHNWETIVKKLNQLGYETGLVSDFAGDHFARIDYGFKFRKTPHLTMSNLIRQRCLEYHYFLQGFLIHPLGRKIFPVMWIMPLNIDPYYVTDASKSFIRRSILRKKPFFLTYFSSNCHFPYGSPYPYYKLYTPPDYRGKNKFRKIDMMKTHSGFRVSEEDREQIVALYDGAVRLFDDQLKEILDFLKASRVENNTLIVLFSDHGESLYEDHFGSGHGDHLRGPYSNNMTLAFHSPFEEFPVKVIDKTVRDIDIAPTLLDMLGVAIPANYRGTSLLPFMRGKEFNGLPAYLETGIWYTRDTPYIPNRPRIYYPDVTTILEIDPQSDELILKKDYQRIVIEAKHRGLELNSKKYIFMPARIGFREEVYLNEQPVVNPVEFKKIAREAKEIIIKLFPDRYFVRKDGRLVEKISN